MAQKLISTAILIAILCQLSHQNPTPKPSEQSMNDMYTECNSRITSRCFAMPSGCIDKLSCDVLLAVTPSDTGADFMMFWNRNSSGPDNWVGAALSEDMKMGNDSITECILEKDNTVLVRQGLTYGGDKYGVNTVEPVQGITKEVGNVSNSIVSCSWSRVDDTMVKTLDFNILNDKYYVFLAYGPMGDKDQLKHHSKIWISKEAEYLAKKTSAPTTTSKPTSEPSEQLMNEMYTECNSRMTSRCFAMPSGCIKILSCDVLLAVKPSETGADFMMFWNRNSSGPDNWVGAALSEDKKMGNDSITECILEKNNAVLVRQGLTYGGDKYGVNTVEPVRGITKEVGNVSNSIVSCSWSRVDDTMVKTLDFNILNKKYYILLAYGPVSDKDELKHHSNIWISEKAEYLAKEITTNAPSTTSKPT